MKKLLLPLLILVFGPCLFAQTELMIRNGDSGLYLEHTVATKENFYSIGRLYNVHPKELSAYNNLEMANGLSIAQVIRIPLTATNFSQTSNKGIPVFYKVGEKEGLYRISTNHNKVLLENLRKWNNLSNDNVPVGSNLIVGYLMSGEIQNTVIKEFPKKDTNFINPPITYTDPPGEQKKEEKIKDKAAPVKSTAAEEVKINSSDAGYFKPYFDQQIKTYPVSKDQTVTSGIFKTASGWQDGKYYLLIDNVEPGMIVKISNPANGKMLFAKVLGQMNGIRQNQGLNIRISNAAASVLQIEETDKFIVKVNY